MTIGIRDADLTLSQVLKMNMREVPSYYNSSVQYHTVVTSWMNNVWEKSNMPAYDKPARIHCKTGSLSARLVFETRAKCQDFVPKKEMMVSPTKLIVQISEVGVNKSLSFIARVLVCVGAPFS